jgi:succinate dehydrogenase/fumarate reductase flavoprotein subunit
MLSAATVGTLASLMVLQAASATAPNTYDLLVIGGGSAGLTAAKFARTFGKSVAILEKAKLGGDCTWTGCAASCGHACAPPQFASAQPM